MSRFQKCILNTFTLLSLNIIFWLSGHYPRHIFRAYTDIHVFTIILNALFCITYAVFLITVFRQNSTLIGGTEQSDERKLLIREKITYIMLVMIVQLVTDVIASSTNEVHYAWRYHVLDILMGVSWVVVYLLLARKEVRLRMSRRVIVTGTLTIVALIMLSVLINVVLLSDYSALLCKYEVKSPIVTAKLTNIEFIYEIKSLVIDTLVGVMFVWLHAYTASSKHCVNEQPKRLSVFALRIALLLFILQLVAGFRILIWSDGAIVSGNAYNGRNTNYEKYGYFDLQYEGREIKRYSKVLNTESICYQTCKTRVQEGESDSICLDTPWFGDLYTHIACNNAVVRTDLFYDCSVDGVVAYLYACQVITFYDEETPVAIHLNALWNIEENPIITEICERLLVEGNIFVFEYVCEYLCKYDPDFITSYIDRYSKGEFTNTETEWMRLSFYRSDYVMSVANDWYQLNKN